MGFEGLVMKKGSCRSDLKGWEGQGGGGPRGVPVARVDHPQPSFQNEETDDLAFLFTTVYPYCNRSRHWVSPVRKGGRGMWEVPQT